MNTIAFRVPGGKAEVYRVGNPAPLDLSVLEEGFAVTTFEDPEGAFLYPFEDKLSRIPEEVLSENHVPFVFPEFSYERYSEYIEVIKKGIAGDLRKKVVASRRKMLRFDSTLDRLFKVLCEAYPDAFVFFISTMEFGTWIGASPELLLDRKGSAIKSMSLAGTRPAGLEEPWDDKNKKEQEIVTLYIREVFESNGFVCDVEGPVTSRAGGIEHLKSEISTEISQDSDIRVLGKILSLLSPTPALSGFPKKEAMRTIREFEGKRVLYGGFCGPLWRNGDFRFNVILRCAYLSPGGHALLFSGGGITAMSATQAEWDETERKMKTLSEKLELT